MAEYNHAHVRLRRALIAGRTWLGQPCHYCGVAMMPGDQLELGHKDDAEGRSIPGAYVGLVHKACNASSGGKVNPWGVRTRAAEAEANRSPERQRELDDKAARKQRKIDRAEWDRIQRGIADGTI